MVFNGSMLSRTMNINIPGYDDIYPGVRRYLSRGTRIFIPGYEDIYCEVRGYYCLIVRGPGYEGISVRGTRVLVSGVRGYYCLGYEGIRLVQGY